VRTGLRRGDVPELTFVTTFGLVNFLAGFHALTAMQNPKKARVFCVLVLSSNTAYFKVEMLLIPFLNDTSPLVDDNPSRSSPRPY